MVDNHLNVQQAADAPRFHHQYLPDDLQVEKRFSVSTSDVLKAHGYNVKRSGEFDEHNPGVWGDSELIAVDPTTDDLLGGHDTRKNYGSACRLLITTNRVHPVTMRSSQIFFDIAIFPKWHRLETLSLKGLGRR